MGIFTRNRPATQAGSHVNHGPWADDGTDINNGPHHDDSSIMDFSLFPNKWTGFNPGIDLGQILERDGWIASVQLHFRLVH